MHCGLWPACAGTCAGRGRHTPWRRALSVGSAINREAAPEPEPGVDARTPSRAGTPRARRLGNQPGSSGLTRSISAMSAVHGTRKISSQPARSRFAIASATASGVWRVIVFATPSAIAGPNTFR